MLSSARLALCVFLFALCRRKAGTRVGVSSAAFWCVRTRSFYMSSRASQQRRVERISQTARSRLRGMFARNFFVTKVTFPHKNYWSSIRDPATAVASRFFHRVILSQLRQRRSWLRMTRCRDVARIPFAGEGSPLPHSRFILRLRIMFAQTRALPSPAEFHLGFAELPNRMRREWVWLARTSVHRKHLLSMQFAANICSYGSPHPPQAVPHRVFARKLRLFAKGEKVPKFACKLELYRHRRYWPAWGRLL